MSNAILTTIFLFNRFWLLIIVLIYCAVFPVLFCLNDRLFPNFTMPIYGLVMYALVFNGLVIALGGKYLISTITYPYSNRWFSSHLKRSTNIRFGREFLKCIERISYLVEDWSER